MTKQEQIDEMTKFIQIEYEQWLDTTGVIPKATTYYAECLGCAIDSAEALYNAGYRKVPDGAVVLTPEERGDEYVETPKWEFTEDEKTILRNLRETYKWIARDGDHRADICVYEDKPQKQNNTWWNVFSYDRLSLFKHIFQTIKWEDDEPCEFRKYI